LSQLLQSGEYFKNKILKLEAANSTHKYLQVRVHEFIYDNQDCKMIDFQDITEVHENAFIKEEQKSMALFQSCLNHEMITPLKCMISCVSRIVESTEGVDSQIQKYVGLVNNTAKLLMS
jgi:hypothetical protein